MSHQIFDHISDPITFFRNAETHEEVLFFYDKKVGLKVIIGIHDTTLGPALGGTRFWHYTHERDALQDVLRLSQGMTYKSALADLNLGGGKAVIIGDARKIKTKSLLHCYGKILNKLHGRYITSEDVNITLEDIAQVSQISKHVVGLPLAQGGSGDPSHLTAYGTYLGMKAAVKYFYGSEKLFKKKVGIEGVGKVGSYLIALLKKEDADIYVTDTSSTRLQYISQTYPFVKVVDRENFYKFDMDIYSPCALGATLNDTTIPILQCKIIAGAANNQLANESIHGQQLFDKKIVYAPDILINAGGVMSVYEELHGPYNKKKAKQRVEIIFDKCLAILQQSEQKKTPPHFIAKKWALQRLGEVKKKY